MNQTLDAPVKKKLPLCDYDLATTHDVVALTYLFKDFFAESDYAGNGITYSPNKAAAWLKRVISTGAFPHVIARVDGKIAGVISWSMDDSFCEEPIAVLHTIYVRPEYRRSPIGRMLVSFMLDIAKNEGACAISAPISSGMKETKSLQNLFAKAGFEHAGAIMTRAF